MTPFYVKELNSGQKPHGLRNKMCRDSQLRGFTNFPPIAEYKQLTSPPSQRRLSLGERTPEKSTTGASRPRSNSENSLGNLWSSSRRSISSSNGHSSMSFSSGDASTVASTERLWRRRKLSPRRVNNTRPVTPFPGEDASHNSTPREVPSNVSITPSPPQSQSNCNDRSRRRSTTLNLGNKNQPKVEKQIITGKATSTSSCGNMQSTLYQKPHPPTSQPQQRCEGTREPERRRRRSMPDIYQRPKGAEVRKNKTESAETSVTDVMDRVTRQRIMNWLSEVAQAKDEDRDNLQEALSAIDEE